MRSHKASVDWQEQLRRGGLELAVMLTVASGPRYGLEIIRHLEELTDLVVTEGTIYPLLARLTRDGLLAAEWNAEEAAHPRKYYRVTAAGRRELASMAAHWRDFSRKIDRLIDIAARQGSL
jgi:PadR family transcriptional regulator, regulatory protein PadR